MRLLIRYSSATDEVEIVGSRKDLGELASQLLQAEESAIQGGQGLRGSYERLLRKIAIKNKPGKGVRFHVTDRDDLTVEGNAKELAILAKNVGEFAEKAALDEHLHVEYFPGHFYLASDSAPVVFAFE